MSVTYAPQAMMRHKSSPSIHITYLCWIILVHNKSWTNWGNLFFEFGENFLKELIIMLLQFRIIYSYNTKHMDISTTSSIILMAIFQVSHGPYSISSTMFEKTFVNQWHRFVWTWYPSCYPINSVKLLKDVTSCNNKFPNKIQHYRNSHVIVVCTMYIHTIMQDKQDSM